MSSNRQERSIHPTSKNLPRLMTVALVAALLLVTTIGHAQEVTLVFRQSDPPASAKGLETAIEEFTANNPNVKVKYEIVPWKDALQQYIRETAVGAGPDVLMSAFVWTRDLAKAGKVLNLDPLIKNDPLPRGTGDFIALDLALFNDNVYGIPWTSDTISMVYRQDLLEAAGIKMFPEDSWASFQEAVKKLTRPRDKQYGFAFAAGSSFQCGSDFMSDYYLWSNGYTYIEQAPDGSWRPGVDVNTLADTIRYFKRFFDEKITPDSLLASDDLHDPQIISGLSTGQYAVAFLAPAGMESVLNANPKAPILSGQLPAGKVRRISHLGGRTLVINKNTKHPDLAWKLLKWMASDHVMGKYYSQQFSAQKAQLKVIKYPSYFEGYVKMIPQAQTYYTYVMSPMRVATKRELVNREFNAAYSGAKSVEDAAKSIIEKIRADLKK